MGGSEFLIGLFLRSKTSDKGNSDKNSFFLIWVGVAVCIVLSLYVASKYKFRISSHGFISYVGLALIFVGVVLRLIVIKSLGSFFTANVTIREDHKLKTDGFYRFLRHPSYSASILSFIGFGVSLNNWFSLLIILGVMLFVFISRIKIEEKVLMQYFGDSYIEYKKSTNALIPFIY